MAEVRGFEAKARDKLKAEWLNGKGKERARGCERMARMRLKAELQK